MKYSNLIFVFLIACAVRGQKESLKNDRQNSPQEEEREEKSVDKRWLMKNHVQEVREIPLVLDEFSNTYIETDPKGQERAKEEKTPRDFLTKGPIESVLIDFLNPKPIVDTASRRELNLVSPGNKGDLLGNLVVKGSNTISRVINSLGPPKKTIRLSPSTMEALNQLGTYISGL